MSLALATDTPRATKAPVTKPRLTPVTVTNTVPTVAPVAPTVAAVKSVDFAAFVKVVKADNKAVAVKARIIGEAISGGSTTGDIAKVLTSALIDAGLYVPTSFSASVTHYATAYKAAATVLMSGSDDALHAAYSISTGAVKAKERESMVANFSGTVPEFVAACRALLVAARAAKSGAAAKPEEPTETPESELETISPVAEFARLMKQATAMLALALGADDMSDYDAMIDAALPLIEACELSA